MRLMEATIASEVTYTGIGLHSGQPVKMTLKPAETGVGIIFIRTDLLGHPQVRAVIGNVTNTMRATTLENGEAKVVTVEHVLAALYGLEINNCYVELDSPEPPVADGSGKVFAELIESAGIVEQSANRVIYSVKKQHLIEEEGKFIAIVPHDGFRITFTSINPHPLLGVQFVDYEVNPRVFMDEISKARTIGFVDEIDALQKMGLAKGGTLENVVVYDKITCLSKTRFPDELPRHKVLDVLGDISLLGPINGHIIAVRSSHALNSKLAKSIQLEIDQEVFKL